LHSNPAAFPANPPEPRLVEAYGKLPLSFEINKGQTDSQVKFLSRGSGYSLFLTGNEAVLSLRKSNSNGKKQMAKGVAQGFPRPRRDGAHFNPAVLPGLFAGPGAHENEAAFPAYFRTPSAELTDSAPATDCRGKDLEKPQGLKGEPCATPTTDAVLHMKLVGANERAKVTGLEELPGKSNYFIGSDPKKWRTNVPNYAKVKYANVYPGVDLVYYGNQGQLEYDFVVRPGADPRSIQLAIVSDKQVGSRQKAVGSAREAPDRAPEGQSAIDNRKSSIPAALHVNATGDLVVGTDGGEVIFHKPVVYQLDESRPSSVVTRQLRSTKDQGQGTRDGGKHYVDGQYVLRSDQSVAFQVASYDPAKPLVIDPALAYSTRLGGGGVDYGDEIAVDTSGNVYVSGITFSQRFPTTAGAFQTTCGSRTSSCVFVSKLNARGSALIYSTYLGGTVQDLVSGIAVDASGNAYLTGSTASSDFPTTSGAFQTTYGRSIDAFVSKLNAAGSALLYSSYLGGRGNDVGTAITLDGSGNAYVTGDAGANFPTTPGAFQTTDRGTDVFVVKISPADAPGLALGPGELIFGPQALSTTSAPQAVTLLDAGSQPLRITSMVASGDFAQTNTCASIVPNGTTCTISVTFNPTATGVRTGTVTITDDAAGSPHKLLLTGTGTGGQPAVSLKPPNVSFVVLRTVGTASLRQTVTLANVGGGQLNINSLSVGGPDPGDFVQSNSCPPTLAAGASCLITVIFKPTAQGVRTASVSITDNAPGSPQTVPLSGRATFFEWAPRSMNMGIQKVGTSSVARTVTLTNVGVAPIAIFSITLAGGNPGDFSQTNTCGSSLKAGARCTIEVTFTPTAVGGRIGHVAVQDNAFGGTHWVGLLGTGR
jgi:hypothetical protein